MICKQCKKANVISPIVLATYLEWECWYCGAFNSVTNTENNSKNIDNPKLNKWQIARKIMEKWNFSLHKFHYTDLDNIRLAIAEAYDLGVTQTEETKQLTNNIPVQTSVTIPVEKMLAEIRQHYTNIITPIFQKVLSGESTEAEKIKLVKALNLIQELGNPHWSLNHSEMLTHYSKISGHWADLFANNFFKVNPNVNEVLMSILNDGKSEIVWVCNRVKVG